MEKPIATGAKIDEEIIANITEASRDTVVAEEAGSNTASASASAAAAEAEKSKSAKSPKKSKKNKQKQQPVSVEV